MRDYYKILEVDRDAAHDTIKKAYRKLAHSYHPDKNQDPRSNEVFALLSEAYQVIGNEERRANYNYLYDAYLLNKLLKMYEDEQQNKYRRNYRTAARQDRQPFSKAANVVDFSQYAPFTKWISIVTFTFCILLLIDFLTVMSYNHEVVNGKVSQASVTRWNANYSVHTVKTGNVEFFLDPEKLAYVDRGDTINVFTTPLLNVTTRIDRFTNRSMFSFAPHYSIYNIFSFFPITLLVISFIGTFLFKNPENVFNAGVANAILLPVVLYILFVS